MMAKLKDKMLPGIKGPDTKAMTEVCSDAFVSPGLDLKQEEKQEKRIVLNQIL